MLGYFFKYIPFFSKPKPSLGAVPNPLDLRDIQLSSFQAPVKLPDEYFTDISMLPVMNQKAHGTCVGQAEGTVVAYFDFLENKNSDISRRYIYGKAKKEDGIPDSQGTYPRVAAGIVSKIGAVTSKSVPDNNDLPYNEYLAFDDTLGLINEAGKRKANYAKVGTDIDSLKQAIYQNKLVTISLYVDFEAWTQIGVLNAPTPSKVVGLHRVTLFGFRGNTFFGRNSWGSAWGASGNFYFKYEDYAQYMLDALCYTDIPNLLLEDAKNKDFVFTQTMRIGMTGPEVKKLQEYLEVFPVSGYFGPLTQKAVMKFQTSQSLKADGVVGPTTLNRLNKKDVKTSSLEKAIIQVESGGDIFAVGDKTLKNKAYGCMQIRQGVCDYINGKMGLKIKAEQMLGNPELSLFVFREWQARVNPNGTDEDKAKSWNGGAGWEQRKGKPEYASYNKSVEDYWRKVEKLL